MIRTVSALLVTGVALLAAPASHAIPMTYDFSGTCTIQCGNLNLADNAVVGGYITAGDGFETDGLLWASELIGFDLTFGSVHITTGDFHVFGGFGLNADLSLNDSLGGLTFQSWQTGATTGSIGGTSGWTARISTLLFSAKTAGGPGDYTLATRVPEPSTLALLGVGLLTVGVAGRKVAGRKRSPCSNNNRR